MYVLVMSWLTRCPFCGNEERDNGETVDIGVGYQKVSAHECTRCGASERGPVEQPPSGITYHEWSCGWWAPEPGREIGVTPDEVLVGLLVNPRLFESVAALIKSMRIAGPWERYEGTWARFVVTDDPTSTERIVAQVTAEGFSVHAVVSVKAGESRTTSLPDERAAMKFCDDALRNAGWTLIDA